MAEVPQTLRARMGPFRS